MPHEEVDQTSARGGALQQLVDEAFNLAQCGDMPAAVSRMEAACRCEVATGSTHEMLAQFYMEGDRPTDALLAAQYALRLGDQAPEAHLTLARAHMACMNLQDALQEFHCCTELLEKHDTHLKQSDVREQAAECEAILQRTWEQRIGLCPLRIHQNIGDFHSRILHIHKTAARAIIMHHAGGKSGPGCVVWESGLALAEYLSQHHEAEELHGCKVLELGAGTGVAGLCAALLGADVTVTDTASCMPLLVHNVNTHCCHILRAGGRAEACVLDWSEGEHFCLDSFGGYQMILGADLVYNRQGVAQLLATLRRLLSRSPNVQMLLGHCSRHACVDQLLFAGLTDIGLAVTRVARSEQDGRVSVYRRVPPL